MMGGNCQYKLTSGILWFLVWVESSHTVLLKLAWFRVDVSYERKIEPGRHFGLKWAD